LGVGVIDSDAPGSYSKKIMKKLSCKDLGSADCNFVATGATNEEVQQKMFAHAAKDHPEKMATMTPGQIQQSAQLMKRLLDAQE